MWAKSAMLRAGRMGGGLPSSVRIFHALVVTLCVAGCGRSSTHDAKREQAYRINNVGVALLEQFKYPEAVDAFRQALAAHPALAIAHINLSIALFYAQDQQGAAREAAEAARLLPAAPEPHYVLGLLARSQNRATDAEREFEQVRRLVPGDVGTDINLGQIYLEQRRYPQAIETLRRAASAEPYNVTAVYNLGLALTRHGHADEGRQFLERAQSLRTTSYAVTFGTGYLEQGRYAEAIASSGNEAELVDSAVPANTFTHESVGPSPPALQQASSPFGRRITSGELTEDGRRALAASLGGCVAPIDFDGDGDLDLYTASSEGQRLFRNDNGAWTDVSSVSGFSRAAATHVPIGCVAGDYDNDGRADLFALSYGGHTLYHNDGDGRFRDITAQSGIPPYPFLPGAAAWVDVDHDGDLDLIVAGLADLTASKSSDSNRLMTFPRDFTPAPLLLLRNNGDGSFADITAAAKLNSRHHAIAVVPTDFDNRRDIDLLIVSADGPPALFQNMRDGTFRDVAADVGLLTAVGSDGIASVAVGDVNKDDFPDVFFGRVTSGVFAMSDGRGRFGSAQAHLSDASRGSQFADYDNDGLLDLLTWGARGLSIFRNLGRQWSDVTPTALPGTRAVTASPIAAWGVALGDLNGDGVTDIATAAHSALAVWRNRIEGARNQSVRIQLQGRVSNRFGVGSKVQLRSGSLKTRLETSATTPPVAPSDLVFGLGVRMGADVVRVLWPSGNLQAETDPLVAGRDRPNVVQEVNRKPSSCPFLFTWNGERFEFVTDFMGAGEMGGWAGPGQWNYPDPVEYVRIRADQLRAKDGRFEIRVTNELEETLYADHLQLLVVSHPADTEVFPNEGMTNPPKPFRLFAVHDTQVPSHVVDDGGRDVTTRIVRVDRQFVDDFALERIRGYAVDHALTIELGKPAQATALLLTGWTDYAFSSDNLAAAQRGLSLTPPSLQIRDNRGRWRTAIADIGIPVGRPQTLVVDLSGHLRPGEHEVRIVTNMRIYWDQILVGRIGVLGGVITTAMDPLTATLRARGFSAEVRPGGGEPAVYDYQQVTTGSPWKQMIGRYTREGDVRPLLLRSDDMFVVARSGDEISLSFDAGLVPMLQKGWTRTFLLLADGFSKEMDINSGSPDLVEPLPFHRMTRYPYQTPERYPDTEQHQRYRETYNTRDVLRSLPLLIAPEIEKRRD
jgi:tetratricopeptide (TPR) repeat protein